MKIVRQKLENIIQKMLQVGNTMENIYIATDIN